MSYRINEIFYSLQGEGTYTGTPAVFIRFAGCNAKCPFCDTDFRAYKTLSLDGIFETIEAVAPEGVQLVVLTGGEPSLQVDRALIFRLRQRFKVVAMETNGTSATIAGCFITASPKEDFFPAAKVNLQFADEVKVVFDGIHDPEKWRERISANAYFIQPCDTQDDQENAVILAKAVEFCKQHPGWRLSLQTQKILNIR